MKKKQKTKQNKTKTKKKKQKTIKQKNLKAENFGDFHHCRLWRNQKPQLSGKRAIIEQNGVKFGTRGYLYNI